MKVKQFSKDVTVDVKFDTERLGVGEGEISYYGNKLGNTKTEQLKLILNRMKHNAEELESAIQRLDFFIQLEEEKNNNE